MVNDLHLDATEPNNRRKLRMKSRKQSTFGLKYTSALIAFIYVLLLLFSTTASASSVSFDYNTVKKEIQFNKDMGFTLDEDPQSHSAFISPNFYTVFERSFEHENSSNAYYSFFCNDWIVLNYDSSNPTPLRRLWIYYSSSEPIEAQAVTFSFANTDYTFEQIYYPYSSLSKYDNGDSRQDIVIIFGKDNIDFIYDLVDYVLQTENLATDEILALPQIKVTFHGTKNITTELPNTFLMDFVDTCLLPLGDMSFIDVVAMNENSTLMKTSSSYKSYKEGTLILGENGEFAISTNSAYTYNTKNSDLSGYETTDKYMFEHMENMVCIVHSYTNSAHIAYYPTESNKDLSYSKLLEKCLNLQYNDSSPFYEHDISFKFDLPQLIVTSIGDTIFGKAYYTDIYIVLENGIVLVSGNSTDNDNAHAFVEEIANSIKAKADNNFILPQEK